MGPKYERPKIETPGTYRAAAASTESLGDARWWSLFQDEELQKLVKAALAGSPNVQVAAARVAQAQAQVGLARGEQFPTIGAQGGASRQRSASTPFFPEL